MCRLAALSQALALVLPASAMLDVADAAMPETLTMPLDCRLGEDCWVVRFVDHDPGPGVLDFNCGGMAGDGHMGTDFLLRDGLAVAAGVTVRAAASGRVAAVRDGMEDRLVDPGLAESVGDRACGNGVSIDHGEGWFSLYCHMRRGSPLVAEGDKVRAGQSLGFVGFSGQTSFPHLHFDLRYQDRPVDPFVGPSQSSTCGGWEGALWARDVLEAVDLQAPLLIASGITASTPEEDDIQRGWHRGRALPSTSPVLTLWADGWWFELGDQLRFILRNPEGHLVIDRQFDVGQDHQRWTSFASAPRPSDGWPLGTYRGEVQVQRAGQATKDVIHTVINIHK